MTPPITLVPPNMTTVQKQALYSLGSALMRCAADEVPAEAVRALVTTTYGAMTVAKATGNAIMVDPAKSKVGSKI